MNKIDIKNTLLEHKRKVLNNLQQTRDYYKDGMDLEEGTSMDPEDFSHQSEWTDMVMKMDLRIAEANQTIDILEGLSTEKSMTATPGAMVRLDRSKLWMYLGTPFPKTKIQDMQIVGVSSQAPIYKVLQGLGEGDSFEFRGKKQVIAEIH